MTGTSVCYLPMKQHLLVMPAKPVPSECLQWEICSKQGEPCSMYSRWQSLGPPVNPSPHMEKAKVTKKTGRRWAISFAKLIRGPRVLCVAQANTYLLVLTSVFTWGGLSRHHQLIEVRIWLRQANRRQSIPMMMPV